MTVTALLVSHDGARWLPAVLDGLHEQTRRPDRLVVVDTGSGDASRDLVAARHGEDAVVPMPAETCFPDAVARGLAEVPDGGEQQWLWILHDDSRPAPDALERLLDAAAAQPSAAVLGPKIREWPSLRRLLEVGVTLSGTGGRETGLERGEYDQGQHDRTRDVLAVSSAGMLVRRDALEALGGFDRNLPLFGNDLDLGWRAARAGYRTLVVPGAVVFHAEAAHRGRRRSALAASPRRQERAAALYTLLAGCSAAALPFVAVRLLLGSLLRAVGFLLVRSPGEAVDELGALLATVVRPDRVLRGRRARRRTATVPAREVRHLLAPPWTPYRHGLDFVSDLVTAVARQASDVSAVRRSRGAVTAAGPVPAEAESLSADTGPLARWLTSPAALGFAFLAVLSVLALRDLVGPGSLAGGSLLPAPDAVDTWWHLHLDGSHDVGVGSAVAAGAYLLPLALSGTVALGSPGLVVHALFLLAVPLAAWGAWRLLRAVVGLRTGADRWPLIWGAATYALLPVVSGALHQGRLGTVAVAVVLPWTVHAGLFLGPAHTQDRRWRAAWRTALGLAVLTAFSPVTWLVAAGVSGALLVAQLVRAGVGSWRPRDVGPVLVGLLAAPALLMPWLLGGARAPDWWLRDAGLAAPELVTDLAVWSVLAGRAAETGAAPVWISLGLPVAAAAALVRRSTRTAVLLCWVPLLAALGAVMLLDSRGLWSGSALLLAHGAAVLAVVLAGIGLADRVAGHSFGWRQPLALLVVLGAALVPVAGATWWLLSDADRPLGRGAAHQLPAYMVAAAERDPASGVLVVGATPRGLEHTLVRGPGLRLGEDSVLVGGDREDDLTDLVGDLATAPTTDDVAALSASGVEFVYLPPPADPALAGNLDSVTGVATASAVRPGARAWQVDAEPAFSRPPPGNLHVALVALQAVALVLVVVLAVPSRRRRR